MKVVAFNGSARRDGNTAALIRHVCSELETEGIQTTLIQLAGETIRGCIACYRCFERRDGQCAVTGDVVNHCIEQMQDADGIIIGSPTYFADVTAETKALIDRAGMVGRANYECYRRKVGAAVVAARRAGGTHAFDTINHFFGISQMVTVGSSYWNIGIGRDVGAVEADTEGVETMKTLGKNMAWLLKKLYE